MMAAAASRSALAMAVLPLIGAAALLLSLPAVAAEEEPLYLESPCPLESIVLSSVKAALRRDIALAAGLLRIFFHDCFPQGCDASVYLKGAKSEQAMGPNLTLQPGALQLVEDIRAKVHKACGPTVSCTDISALATRAAVVLSGGPSYPVPIGQLDSLAPAPESAVNQLPSPFTATVKELLASFKSRGLGEPADLVALSGGHTVGRAVCDFVRPATDPFSKKMKANCTRNPKILQDLDVITPNAFDNGYYKALTLKEGVFVSDMALLQDPRTAPIVKLFAKDKAAFFAQFAKSIVKLSKVPRTVPGGEIRRISCFKPNGPRLVDGDGDDSSEEGFAASV